MKSERLTVAEQMKFCALLKNVPASSVDSEVESFLERSGLSSKGCEFFENLSGEFYVLTQIAVSHAIGLLFSGGMQRKLSIMFAFIGQSKTVVLDEPTAGVDPYFRRSIWKLILEQRTGRTVILSTHFMDEADFLGDRIAIISDGKLQCAGSSSFLKKRFSPGFYLTCVNALPVIENEAEPSPICASQKASAMKRNDNLIRFVFEHLPQSSVTEAFGQEIRFLIPTDDLRSLRDFFVDFDSKLRQLGVITYGLSESSLEEVASACYLNCSPSVIWT
uniref:ATPase_AAA_core domain-containing protein n=1 Tax=Soboliphyme baturini TaxID=241478 RepID=A0A183J738_9BILA